MNNRAFKKVNLVDLSYNLSSKVMKIPTESSTIYLKLDVIIKDIKKNPQETVLKLEKLHNEINISYEGLPLDKLLLDAGFNPEDTYPPGN